MALISDTHKFVFVHIPKTAGTSINAALGKLASFSLELHMMPNKILDAFPDTKDYLWVTVVRNPYDRLVSWYEYMRSNESDPNHVTVRGKTFQEFLEWRMPVRTQWDYIKSAHIKNWEVLEFENLDECFQEFCELMKLDNIFLPKFNRSDRTKSHYSKYYEDIDLDKFYPYILPDCQAFNYGFERP